MLAEIKELLELLVMGGWSWLLDVFIVAVHLLINTNRFYFHLGYLRLTIIAELMGVFFFFYLS